MDPLKPRNFHNCHDLITVSDGIKLIYDDHHVKDDTTNSNKETLKCTVCGVELKYESDLIRHMRTHSGEKPFACNLCEKRFNRKGTLLLHMRTHTGEKPFACSSCEKTFSQKIHLVYHIRSHTGEKPFTCSVCQKKFSRGSHFVSHGRIHTGEKPFECKICGKKFTRRDYIYCHLKIHMGKTLFVCKICRNEYHSKSNFQTHLKIHHEKKQSSQDLCQEIILTKDILNKHTWNNFIKKYPCRFCKKNFSSKFKLIQHNITHVSVRLSRCDKDVRNCSGKCLSNMLPLIQSGKKTMSCETYGEKHPNPIYSMNVNECHIEERISHDVRWEKVSHESNSPSKKEKDDNITPAIQFMEVFEDTDKQTFALSHQFKKEADLSDVLVETYSVKSFCDSFKSENVKCETYLEESLGDD